jgi:hypothetical protein
MVQQTSIRTRTTRTSEQAAPQATVVSAAATSARSRRRRRAAGARNAAGSRSGTILPGLTTALVVLDDAADHADRTRPPRPARRERAPSVGRAIGELVHPSQSSSRCAGARSQTGSPSVSRAHCARRPIREVVLDCRAAPLEHDRFLLLEIVRYRARPQSAPREALVRRSNSYRDGSFASSRTR